jgi:threonine/homoserine/homoserine lactone efflux protein
MISLETAATFLGVAVLLGLTPGPDNLFVMAQSIAAGARAGCMVVLGLCSGLVVHTLAVAMGLAAVLAGAPLALQTIQMLGAVYLLYLAWAAWPARPRGHTEVPVHASTEDSGFAHSAREGRAPPAWALWRRGVIMNLSNPKVVLFFLALLPQFVDTTRGAAAPQILVLGALFILATLLVFGGLSYFSASVGDAMRRRPGVQAQLDRISSLVFVGLAIRLVWTG